MELQIAQHSVLDQSRVHKGFATTCDVLLDTSKAFANVDDVQPIVFHRGTASCRIVSRRYQCKPAGSTTSTRRPSKSSGSATRPPGKKALWSGRTSTSRSTSLAGPASPRATEPKTRTLYAP